MNPGRKRRVGAVCLRLVGSRSWPYPGKDEGEALIPVAAMKVGVGLFEAGKRLQPC